MKLFVVVPTISAIATVIVAQATPTNATTVLTVGFVSTVFLAGGGFFVTRHKANSAHARITKLEAEGKQRDEKLEGKLEELRQLQAAQHGGVMGAFAALEIRIIERINEAATNAREFDRRERGDR